MLDVFYTSVKMSPYLVAVVVAFEYDAVESDLVEGGPVTKVGRPKLSPTKVRKHPNPDLGSCHRRCSRKS